MASSCWIRLVSREAIPVSLPVWNLQRMVWKMMSIPRRKFKIIVTVLQMTSTRPIPRKSPVLFVIRTAVLHVASSASQTYLSSVYTRSTNFIQL